MKTIVVLGALGVSGSRLAPMEFALLMMLAIFCIMGGIGLYEAWSKKRGLLGWIVSVITSIVGGAVVMGLSIAVLDSLISGFPKSSIALIADMLFMVVPVLMFLGSWLALRLVNRFR